MEKELTPKQQVSEALRSAQTVLIITGQRPNVDQATAVMALAAMLRKFGKKVTALVSDPLPASVGFLNAEGIDRDLGGLRDFIVQVDLSNAEVDKLKYTVENGKLNIHITPYQGGFTQRDVGFAYGDYHFDVVIAVGVANYDRLDRVYPANQSVLQSIPLINIDYHRSNQNYGAVNHIDTNAASLGEMLVALAESLQTGMIDDKIATILLTGIMSATDRFASPATTPKSLTVAAQMMAMGAQQSQVIKGLYGKNDGRQNSGQSRPAQTQKPVAEQQPVVTQSAPAPQPAAEPVAPVVPQVVEMPEPIVSEPVEAVTAVEPAAVVEVAPEPTPQPEAAPAEAAPQAAQSAPRTGAPAPNPANRPSILQQ